MRRTSEVLRARHAGAGAGGRDAAAPQPACGVPEGPAQTLSASLGACPPMRQPAGPQDLRGAPPQAWVCPRQPLDAAGCSVHSACDTAAGGTPGLPDPCTLAASGSEGPGQAGWLSQGLGQSPELGSGGWEGVSRGGRPRAGAAARGEPQRPAGAAVGGTGRRLWALADDGATGSPVPGLTSHARWRQAAPGPPRGLSIPRGLGPGSPAELSGPV